MIYYAVFDTNVLVSSLLTKRAESATARVVDAVAEGRIVPLYSEDILREYEDVLRRARFRFSEGRVRALLHMIRQFGMAVDPVPTGEALVDMDDLVFYEVVMARREDDTRLITGNLRHFPPRDFIVTPAEMMALIESESGQGR